MTSRSGMVAVTRELCFGASAVAAPGGPVAPRDGNDDSNGFRFAVDVDTPERWPDVAYDTAAPAAFPDSAMRARLAVVLDDAARTMAQRAPLALRLVNSQMQRVLLRCSATSLGTSTSHRDRVGECLLTNLHQPAEAVQVAIEALTHESIHQLLYRTELADGDFCILAETPTFRSPWSGARLPLHSLVHACFVWFGLLTLWSELALQPASPQEAAHARGRMAHCLFGFAFLDDLLNSAAFPVASVKPDVLDALRGLSALTLHATRAAEPISALQQLSVARQGAPWPANLAAALADAAG